MKTFVKTGMGMVESFCGKKWYWRLLVTVAAALLMMVGVSYVVQLIRDIIAYHTGATFVCLFVGVNALLSRKKLVCIYHKLSAMGNEAQPVANTVNMSDIACKFAEAVNNAEFEEGFED